MATYVYTYIAPNFLTRHALSRRTPCVQNGKFPFDLALSSGCSASILALLQPGSAAWLCVNDGDLEGETKLSLPLPLVSAEEIKVFASLSHLLDPNPRRVKRIINVYALVTEVAKRVPLSEGGSKARSKTFGSVLACCFERKLCMLSSLRVLCTVCH